MVRYVFNCWRARDEVLAVRRQFYGDADADGEGHDAQGHDGDEPGDGRRDATAAAALGQRQRHRLRRRQQRQQAVARVSMWMARQHCSHMVESTALLTAAILSDEAAVGNGHGTGGWATYAVRATYAAAFSRFVTGLLDGHQDKLRKQSMYTVAKKVALPAAFVELRHQSTHEQLPSQAKLRSMAHKALAWIWDYYWKNLAVDGGRTAEGPCREAVLTYLQGDDDDARRHKALRELARWDTDVVLATIAQLQQTLPGNQVYIKCLKLSRELVELRAADMLARGAGAPEQPAATTAADEPVPEPADAAEPSCGWSLLEGPWKAKPIGLV